MPVANFACLEPAQKVLWSRDLIDKVIGERKKREAAAKLERRKMTKAQWRTYRDVKRAAKRNDCLMTDHQATVNYIRDERARELRDIGFTSPMYLWRHQFQYWKGEM